FWWTTPIEGTSDLSRVSGRCGFVVADDSVPGVPEATPMPLGVDLAELEPARPSARRDASAPLLHLSAYEADPRVAPAHRLVETAIAARARVLREPGHLHTPDQTLWPRDVRSCYRAAAWTTPTTDRLSNRCISMLGAGVPVFVCREPKEFGKVVIELPRDASVDEAAASARQRMESPGAVAEVLRTIHRSGTVQQRFFEGLRSLGIEASPPNDGGVGVLIMAGSDIERAVDSITGQSVRPTEVLVDDADMRHLLSVMLGPDIPVKPPALGGSPRHVHWRGKPWPKTHLHDLLIASEVVGTDWFSGDDAPEVTGSASMEMSTPWWIEAQDG
ncbi:MAG: hypothetical protein OXI79_01070, partial [Gammaproteobacteria bacterium]|nr:hypothetical protein [Gammaproteobacteria bacterium]